MINKLPNGHFHGSVLCADGVRRSRTYRHEGSAKLDEALLKTARFAELPKRSAKKVRKHTKTPWSLAKFMAKVLSYTATHKKGRH